MIDISSIDDMRDIKENKVPDSYGDTQYLTQEDMDIIEIGVNMGVKWNKDQIKLIKYCDSSIFSRSIPGSGKTQTAVGKLVYLNSVKQVPGEKILVMSYTVAATGQIESRYRKACKALGMRADTVEFSTLHAQCRAILIKNQKVLGMSHMDIAGERDSDETAKASEQTYLKNLAKFLEKFANSHKLNVDTKKISSVVRAIKTLNSSLVFDPENVTNHIAFKSTGMSYEDFTKLRVAAYMKDRVSESIYVGDILLYTLELFIRKPEIAEEIKASREWLIMDEIQDASPLQVKIISMLSNKVLAIGDMDQQIYGWNGATDKVFDQFLEYFPDAKEINLTTCYRCAREIGDYAKLLIKPNHFGEEIDFNTLDKSGGVYIHEGKNDIEQIAQELKDSYYSNKRVFDKKTMFLFRNNFSANPICEALFRNKVPFYISKYVLAYRLPIIQDLCAVIDLARNPRDVGSLSIVDRFIPELREFKRTQDGLVLLDKNPIYKLMRENGYSFLDVPYKYNNVTLSEKFKNLLVEVIDMLEDNEPVWNMLTKIYELYQQTYLSWQERYLPTPSIAYMNAIQPIASRKTYDEMISDENEKLKWIKDSRNDGQYVELYTMHGAKGLEADRVIAIDVEDEYFPNVKRFESIVNNNCYYDAAKTIRGERCLAYVAVTRAKERVDLYSSGQLADVFKGGNKYQNYDNLYRTYNFKFRDVEYFAEFIDYEIGGN